MFIEFVGIPGSGKTTLAGTLKYLFQEKGFIPLSLNEAIFKCLNRTVLGKYINKWLTSFLWRRRILGRVYFHIFYIYHKYIYMLSNPRFAFSIYRSQLTRKIPRWHRRRLIRKYFDIVVGYSFLRNRLYANEVLIFDEGFIQRAINLYAWESDQIDHGVLRGYFEGVPAMDLIFVVHTSPNRCVQRLHDRGLPREMRTKPRVSLLKFIDNAHHIAELAVKYLFSNNRKVIEVDNEGAIEKSSAVLCRATDDFLSSFGEGKSNP